MKTAQEVFEIIKEYDLFPGANSEDSFTVDIVEPLSDADEMRLKQVVDMITTVDGAVERGIAQLAEWQGPLENDAKEILSNFSKGQLQIYQGFAAMMEHIIEIDWDLYNEPKRDEISRDEYMADELGDEQRLSRLAFRDRGDE